MLNFNQFVLYVAKLMRGQRPTHDKVKSEQVAETDSSV